MFLVLDSTFSALCSAWSILMQYTLLSLSVHSINTSVSHLALLQNLTFFSTFNCTNKKKTMLLVVEQFIS